MSEQKFKESKSSLAFSQALIDRMRAEQSPQMPQEAPMEHEMMEDTPMAEETPQEPVLESTEKVVEEPQEEKQEEKGGIGETLKHFMDEVRGMFEKKEDEDKATIEKTVKSSLTEMLNEEDKNT